jgi:uncharacterized protein YkwD
MLDLVNIEREKSGASPLVWCPLLAQVATKHSQDMVDRQFFDHDNPDGVTPDEREKNAGYDYTLSGENIAVGQRTVREVMVAWMDSPGHRANILTPEFTHFGSGIARGNFEGAKSIYWTQNFGAGGNCAVS